jgi:hypothetical protein
MSNLQDQFKADAEVTATNEELQIISKLSQDQQNWEGNVKQLEIDLEHAKDALRQIQEFLLPEAMAAIGMSEFKLTNGSKITVKHDVYASIRKDFINEAVNWLDTNELGDIVKDKIAVDFDRGQSENSKLLMAHCIGLGYNVSENLSVHPQTLKATVKEQLSKGVEFPEDYFSIALLKKSIIKAIK